MSLTYVLVTLFRGDDIEQSEYVICQMRELSSQPRPILVFNGGAYPRNQQWLEKKFPGVRVIELEIPADWSIDSEFHYCHYVWSQLHKYVETDFYLKVDRDIIICKENFDLLFLDFMRKRPNIGAGGLRHKVKYKQYLDNLNLLQGLPEPVSYSSTQLLNGGIEIFRTSSMSKIGPILDAYAKRIWQETLDVGEDDLISFVLQGTGDRIEYCPLIRVLAGPSDKELAKCYSAFDYDNDTLTKMLSVLFSSNHCIAHGLKPFMYYRPFYELLNRQMGVKETIEKRNMPNDKDEYILREHAPVADGKGCHKQAN